MGKRADVLAEALPKIGIPLAGSKPATSPTLNTLPSDRRSEIVRLFHDLGGRGDTSVLRTGPWDIACADGSIVELDEMLHFNRFRAITLSAAWSANLPWHVDYLEQTATREQECVKAGSHGGRWTNGSCERQFGPAGQHGILDGAGPPRWKQRALYDAMKDATVGRIHLVRLSIYDVVGGVELGTALDRPGRLNLDALRDLFERRSQ